MFPAKHLMERDWVGHIWLLLLALSREVNELVEVLRADGYCVVGEPRITGDGYYEAVILDNEGNRIEIVK